MSKVDLSCPNVGTFQRKMLSLQRAGGRIETGVKLLSMESAAPVDIHLDTYLMTT